MGGCSLNYVDIGDVRSHDYLRGVILAINENDDTCTVEVDGKTLTGVPLFFNGGINTTQRNLSPSSKIWSVKGAALDFEGPVPGQFGSPTVPGDSVYVMIGRGPYDFEIFVLGHVIGKKLRYYLADFKRIYGLHPEIYFTPSYLEHYALDQVVIWPRWYINEYTLYAFAACGIPQLADNIHKKDWYFAIPDCVTGVGTIYNTIFLQVPNAGHYSGFEPLDGMPYRPSPLGQTYTIKTKIFTDDGHEGHVIPPYITPPQFRIDLGYWNALTDRFVSKQVIYPQTTLGLGENDIVCDFKLEDLSLIPDEIGHFIMLRAQVITIGPDSFVASWWTYSILLKEVTP